MKFFIDTANIAEIKEANSMGMVDGVTTNPSLVAKEGRDFEELIQEICEIVDGPVSAEVISLEMQGMINEARHLADIHPNIVVKIPMTVEGLKLLVLGLTSTLYAILDIKSDILVRPHLRSDAAMLAEMTGIPTVFWGFLWIAVALLVSAWLLRWVARRLDRFELDPDPPAPSPIS